MDLRGQLYYMRTRFRFRPDPSVLLASNNAIATLTSTRVTKTDIEDGHSSISVVGDMGYGVWGTHRFPLPFLPIAVYRVGGR